MLDRLAEGRKERWKDCLREEELDGYRYEDTDRHNSHTCCVYTHMHTYTDT